MPIDHQFLEQGFRERDPWACGFTIDGRRYGGPMIAEGDFRVAKFCDRWPAPARVLELGPLEGCHSFALAGRGYQVVAVEGRTTNLERCRWLQGAAFADLPVRFAWGDATAFDFAALGAFDAVFCSGVLYHVPEPWALLRRLAALAPHLFLWTHVADAGEAIANGYAGRHYREHGLADRQSGLADTSFWPTRPALRKMLPDTGWAVESFERASCPNGPAVTALCVRDERSP